MTFFAGKEHDYIFVAYLGFLGKDSVYVFQTLHGTDWHIYMHWGG